MSLTMKVSEGFWAAVMEQDKVGGYGVVVRAGEVKLSLLPLQKMVPGAESLRTSLG